MSVSHRFPATWRVRKGAEYKAVFDARQRVAHPLLNMHWCKTMAPARVGLAVSRKVDKRAVGRNRIKRTIRETMRQLRHQLCGGDYVIVARAAAKTANNAQLRAALAQVLRRAGVLLVPIKSSNVPTATPPVHLPSS